MYCVFTLLGSLAIRHELTDQLRNEGGHIGYSVRPSARRQGHAAQALKDALPLARRLVVEDVLVTCAEGNAGSHPVVPRRGAPWRVDTVVGMDAGKHGTPDKPLNKTERFIRDAAAVVRPGHLSQSGDAGDAWVQGPAGKFWGRFGSAGLLVFDAGRGVLLQHRALWSHHGGTWGLPGGALHRGESAVDGALREAWEEAGVPAGNVSVLFTSVYDVGYWSYTTVAVGVDVPFEPVISDPESLALAWVPAEEVAGLALHPGFGAAWPRLRSRLDAAG